MTIQQTSVAAQNKFITFRANAQKSDQPENWIFNQPKIFIASHNSLWLAIIDSRQNNDFSKLKSEKMKYFPDQISTECDEKMRYSDMDDNSDYNTSCLLCWGVRRYCNCYLSLGVRFWSRYKSISSRQMVPYSSLQVTTITLCSLTRKMIARKWKLWKLQRSWGQRPDLLPNNV